MKQTNKQKKSCFLFRVRGYRPHYLTLIFEFQQETNFLGFQAEILDSRK